MSNSRASKGRLISIVSRIVDVVVYLENRRLLAPLALIAVLVIGSRLYPPLALLLPAAAFIVMVTAIVRYAWRSWRNVWPSALRRGVRVLRGWRRLHELSHFSEFLSSSALIVAVFGLVTLLATGSHVAVSYFTYLTCALLIVSALTDTARLILVIGRIAWARVAGKFVISACSAGILFLSASIAKHVTHSITGVDPSFFIEFVGLLTLLSIPLVCLAIWSVAAGVWSGFLFIGILVQLAISMIFGVVGSHRPHFAYRLRYGKKSPQGYKPSQAVSIEGVSRFMRPIGLLGSIWLASSLMSGVELVFNKYGERALRSALILTEYHFGTQCAGVSKDTAVAYLGDGLISVGRQSGRSWEFMLKTCKVD